MGIGMRWASLWRSQFVVAGLAALAAAEEPEYKGIPLAEAKVWFEERFNDEGWKERWVSSDWKGNMGPSGRFEWSAGKWYADEKEQIGVMTAKDMNYHCISHKLHEPFSNKEDDLVLQLTVKHEQKEYSFCGGGYVKLLGTDFDQKVFGGNTPYEIMFGPDICGYDIGHIHLIFTYKGQNLLRKEQIALDYDDKDELTHLYTLLLHKDNRYEVYFDETLKASGNIHEGNWGFPNRTTDDPADSKPSGWVDEEQMKDPNAKKPDTWADDPNILDPEASQPEEWDSEEDGEWVHPKIDNPKYVGEWIPGMIANPEYKGAWRAKQLPSSAFEEFPTRYTIGGVGFELWTVNKGSIFDNVLITNSMEYAKKMAAEVWKPFAGKEKDKRDAWKKVNRPDDIGEETPAGGVDDMGDDDDNGDDDKDASRKNDKDEEL